MISFPPTLSTGGWGHSDRVATKHYKQVTDQHFTKGTVLVSTGVSITTDQEDITGGQSAVNDDEKHEKPKENADSISITENLQYPVGESNPCYRRERAASWASRRTGLGYAESVTSLRVDTIPFCGYLRSTKHPRLWKLYHYPYCTNFC